MVLVVMLVAGLMVAPVLAQGEVPGEIPSVEPEIEALIEGVGTFLRSGGLVMGLIAFLVIWGLKGIFPDTKWTNTRVIYGVVSGVFAIIYVTAVQFGVEGQANDVVAFLTRFAEPVWQIILLFATSPIVFELFKRTENPVFGAGQGAGWFALEAPGRG
jgi:hypothetical protein